MVGGVEEDQVLPSYALVAVVAGCRWGVVVEGWWRSSRGKVLKDEPVIEMESVYGHYSLNQLACVHL